MWQCSATIHLPWKIVSSKQLFDIFPTATAGKASIGVRAEGRKGGNCLPQKFSVEYDIVRARNLQQFEQKELHNLARLIKKFKVIIFF